MSNTIKVSVLGDVRDINNKLGSVNSQLSGFGKSAGKVGGLLKAAFAGFVVGQVVSGIKSAVDAASLAEQSLGATSTVFGKYADSVVKDSDRAALAFGLSANEYRENANLLGSLFANQGVATDQLAGKTKTMIGQAADLAATFGGTTADAVGALGSAFKGEFDPLERYGISIKASTISAELAARGQDKLTGAALKQAQQVATTDLIMKQSAKSAGAFGRESNTLAGQQQRLSAQFENLKATIGTALLPVLTSVFSFLNNNLVPAFNAVGTFLGPIIARFREFFTAGSSGTSLLAPLVAFIQTSVVPAFMRIVTAVQGLIAVVLPIITQIVTALVGQWSTIQPYVAQVWTAVQSIITSAMSIVQSVITIATAVITAVWNQFGGTILAYATATFRNIATVIGGVFKVISGIFKTVSSVLKGDWAGAWNGIKTIVSGALQVIKGVVSQGINIVKTVFTNGLNLLKTVASAAFRAVVSVIRGFVGNIGSAAKAVLKSATDVFASLGSTLLGAGRDLIQGLINGVGQMGGVLNNAVSSIAQGAINKIKSVFGIKSPSRVFKKIGLQTVEGLAIGLEGGQGAVNDAMSKVTEGITKAYEKSFEKESKTLEKRMKKNGKSTKQIAKATKKLGQESKAATKQTLKGYKAETTAALANAAAREGVYARLADASEALATARKQMDDYASSVRNAITSYGNIASLDAPFTASGLADALRERIAKVQTYVGLLRQLASQGLNSTMYDQLVQAGVEGGLATASAIAAGGPAAIAEFNALQAELGNQASILGTEASNNMYGAGVQAAQGLVAGLEAEKASLERAAAGIAQTLKRAIRKALKIKSPSRVFKEIGAYTIEGLEIGLSNTAGVTKAMTNVADAMTSSYSPDLGTASVALTSASGAGTGQNNYNITVQVEDTMSTEMYGKKIINAIAMAEKAGIRTAA